MSMDDDIREQVRSYLTRLAAGAVPPGEAADWALRVMQDDAVGPVDPHLWRALDELAGADLLAAPGEYLHGPEDFAHWLAEFEAENGG
jgi:hypothetical protein